MNMKPSLPTLCATAISVLMNVGMRNVGGFLGTVVVDAFEFQPFRKFQVRSPTGSHRCGPIPLWVQLEKSETQSPISNKDDESVKNNTTKKKREFRTGMVRNLPSSRSTATFALYENLRRQTTIAVRILENDPNYKALEGRDRSFARLLLTTAERRQGQIDHIIQQLIHQTNKPTKRKKSGDVLCDAALRIGATQILFLDTPAFAAIKETVDVLRIHPSVKVSDPQIKFVNAILRKIDREGVALLSETSVMDNVNTQLAQEWIRSYGKQITEGIVESAMSQSPIFITINLSGKSSKEERKVELERVRDMFSDSSLGIEAELLENGSIRIPDQYPTLVSKWPGYSTGDWWVQDPSASLPAIALETIVSKDHPSKLDKLHVVDLCSAPGGKTAQLCSMGFGKVTAVELSSPRTKALRENLDRLGMTDRCSIVVGDGRVWRPDGTSGTQVDAVLLDAPCSATGVGSRRPDVLQKSPNLEEIISLQRELAVHAIDNLLTDGGILIYATCSLLQSESEDQIRWLLSREDGPGIEILPFQEGEIPGFDSAIHESGWLRVIPGQLPGSYGQCDGFFVARLRRKKQG